MAWYDDAIFYHIYPYGLTDAPKKNSYGVAAQRLNSILPWVTHLKEINCNALYIGPLFESDTHGYDTSDYKKVDSRLGTNNDLKHFVAFCHENGIRVIFDAVFNHTSRGFFAFQDLIRNQEQSCYRDWYRDVDFQGDNTYGDGFSYLNWFDYDSMPIINLSNPKVRDYFCEIVKFWIDEFDVDGLRIDAAHAMDMDFLQALRRTGEQKKPEFWLMGEVIHGNYCDWINERTLHSVTNYQLHSALYCGHNNHNYYEIAQNVSRLYNMFGDYANEVKLYNFVDNHDEERIHTKLHNKAHFLPVHILLYTLPGVPSIYYGSEFGIEGVKHPGCDDSLRPALSLNDFKDAASVNPCTSLITKLGKIRQECRALSRGDYKELFVSNQQYAFSRTYEGSTAIVTVNNDDQKASLSVPAGENQHYYGALSGAEVSATNGMLPVNIKADSGEIWLLKESEGHKAGRADMLLA